MERVPSAIRVSAAGVNEVASESIAPAAHSVSRLGPPPGTAHPRKLRPGSAARAGPGLPGAAPPGISSRGIPEVEIPEGKGGASGCAGVGDTGGEGRRRRVSSLVSWDLDSRVRGAVKERGGGGGGAAEAFFLRRAS